MRMVTAATAALLLASAEPVFAQAENLYDRGVSARLAGRHQEAADLFDRVLSEQPHNVDARLNRGLSLLALGRLNEAQKTFDQVIAAAPDYTDAYIGRARVAVAKGDKAAVDAALADAARTDPGRAAEIAAVRSEIRQQPDAVWRMDVRVSHSELSGSLPPWREQGISVARRFQDGRTLELLAERSERFGDADVYLEARHSAPLGDGSAYVAVGGAIDADHRPQAALKIGGAKPLTPNIQMIADAGVAQYRVGTVSTVQPGLEVSAFDRRLSVQGRWINVWDERGEHRDGYAVRGLWALGPAVRLSAGFADAPESSDGATVDVKARTVGAEVDIGSRLTLRLFGTHEDRAAYDRDAVDLGVGLRF
ncbi:YaiO family outer membrane beta-barrel protein [Brevundimonas fontaquae]|uniref:YaiO family outer membrane beta-barrel protein n=1 Tax=Brevundimonas fontaquae TaxID=2813778 RepID=A0ABX7LNP6_9CAUL|nr:YaiO family outer membrane beta-barrel protein [Brevundimonas fontaquae]QSF54451.1 YaiO family outer membrane beta-barrel protein [Brevundimonas fontaquae]